MEKLLYLLNTLLGEDDELILLIYEIISIFLNLCTHDGIHLADFGRCSTTLHTASQIVAHLVNLS